MTYKLYTYLDSKKSAPKVKQGRKSQATATKVNLMKIKMSAVGDKATPYDERVFLKVLLPRSSKDTMKNMYFSKVTKLILDVYTDVP